MSLNEISLTGESCQWSSGVNSAASRISFSYSTCTTSISTCNDGVCDDLEMMEDSLCPQDCVEKGRLNHSFQRLLMRLVLFRKSEYYDFPFYVFSCEGFHDYYQFNKFNGH